MAKLTDFKKKTCLLYCSNIQYCRVFEALWTIGVILNQHKTFVTTTNINDSNKSQSISFLSLIWGIALFLSPIRVIWFSSHYSRQYFENLFIFWPKKIFETFYLQYQNSILVSVNFPDFYVLLSSISQLQKFFTNEHKEQQDMSTWILIQRT